MNMFLRDLPDVCEECEIVVHVGLSKEVIYWHPKQQEDVSSLDPMFCEACRGIHKPLGVYSAYCPWCGEMLSGAEVPKAPEGDTK